MTITNSGPVDSGVAPRDVRCPGSPTPVDVWTRDLSRLPEELREHWQDPGTNEIDVDRFFSKEFADEEFEHMWKKTWQMVCRVEDIPNVGDTYVYRLGAMSMMIARVAEDEIKAYYNACLHRGTELRECDGRVAEFRCPYHGWTWRLDGSFKSMPSAWDFAHVKDDLQLPQVKVETFGGFVFINPDPDAPPLREYMHPMQEHFERWWPWEQRAKMVHTARTFPCNWKIALSVFQEAYHFLTTHPEMLLLGHDANTQYDSWDRVGRMLFVTGMKPTEDWAGETTEEDLLEVLGAVVGAGDGTVGLGDTDEIELPDGMTAREYAMPIARQRMAEALGVPVEEVPMEEATDYLQYQVFPNLLVELSGLVLRFRPWGDDPNQCLVEIMLFDRFPEGQQPPPVEVTWMGDDGHWADVKGLGPIGAVLDQDINNICRLQRGLKATNKKSIILARYQESLIRWHHHIIDEYLRAGRSSASAQS